MTHRSRRYNRGETRDPGRGYVRFGNIPKPKPLNYGKKNLMVGDRIIENGTGRHGVVKSIKKYHGEKIHIVKLDNGINYAGFSTEFTEE